MAPKRWVRDASQTVYKNGIWKTDYYYSRERSTFRMTLSFIDELSKFIMIQSPQDTLDDGRRTNWYKETTGGLGCPYSSKITWRAVLFAKPRRTIRTRSNPLINQSPLPPNLGASSPRIL